jgi:hypothetical protein
VHGPLGRPRMSNRIQPLGNSVTRLTALSSSLEYRFASLLAACGEAFAHEKAAPVTQLFFHVSKNTVHAVE